MYSASFILEPGSFDAKFHELDALIEAAALATQGYLGAETLKSVDGRITHLIYYWETLESLKAFSSHPQHLEANRQYQQWYKGFHIVISQILKSYGDGVLSHITPNQRAVAA
jgi:heme-degrading monooxygenase HmoA